MAKAAKRRKNKNNDATTHAENVTCLITRLPFELIAEVLLFSKSPANILSLSRTCKHFHATLVQNPIATFIWKRVRTQTTPPIPEPTKLGLSESQFANFIYGGGKCTVRIPPAFTSSRSLVVSGMRQTHRKYVYVVFRSDSLLWESRVSSETFVSPRSFTTRLRCSHAKGKTGLTPTPSLHTRLGYLGSNGRIPMEVGSLGQFTDLADQIQPQMKTLLFAPATTYQ